jgi:hydroxymethylglutaryl-CoA synthase
MSALAIVGWGSSVPRFQLSATAVGAVLGSAGRKSRAVVTYDEDTTTLAAAAARAARTSVPDFMPESLVVATSTPPYHVKSCAATVHAALSLPRRCRAADVGPSTRSGVTALLAALGGSAPSVVAAADRRLERAGAPTELDGADAAVAYLVGDPGEQPPIARLAAAASATIELMDRWQLPSDRFGAQADERATESAYLEAAEDVLTDLFADAERSVDVLVVASEHKRARASLTARSKVTAKRVINAVAGLGCAGAADAGLLLARALENAAAGERILLLALADGVDAMLFDVVADGAANAAPSVAAQVARARGDLPYPTYLAWRGLLERDAGRRPPLAPPAPVPTMRSVRWKFGLVGTRCRKCETVHLPPERVCRNCGAIDEMEDYPVADQLGTIRQVTTDWLAWSPKPPLIQAVVAFDGGGQLRCEVTDAFDGDVRAGDRVAMSFRVLRTVEGIHNYFWKAVPVGDQRKDDA